MDSLENYGTLTETPVSTGTTLVAVEYADGVIIGADSRTSAGTYIVNRVTDKLTKLTDYIFCCRSGSAADTQAIADIVRYRLDFHTVQTGRQPTVLEAATLFQYFCYNYRDNLSAGIIVAGWDDQLGGQVYSVPLGGMLVRQKASIGGSGSTFLYGHLDRTFDPNFAKDKAVEFVRDMVSLAIGRDGSSGGCCRIACINKDGVQRSLWRGNEVPLYLK